MSPHSAREIQVIAPLQDAWRTMKHILFDPFDLKKWCVIGFCAWLANLMASGSSGGSGNFSDSNSETSDGELFAGWFDWAPPIVVGTILTLVAIVVVGILVALIWLSSRGKFMFIDCLVHDRALVKQPWEEFKVPANQLFLLRIVAGTCWILILGVFLTVGILTGVAAIAFGAFQDIASSGTLTGAGVGWILGLTCGTIAIALCLGLFYHLIDHFVVPLMYVRRISGFKALAQAWDLLLENIIPMLLFLLMTIAVAIGAALVTVIAFCATCCLVALPYVGTVVLLPVHVLTTAYALHFVAQFADDLDLLSHAAIKAHASPPPLPTSDPGI